MDEQIVQAKKTLINLVYTDWLSDLFTPSWFGTVAFIIFSYALVFWLLDKRRFTQLILFGSLMTVMITLVDVVGVEYVFWTYLTRVFPIIPSLFLYDFTVIPLYYMLVYQYSPDWKRFALWNAVASGIISFAFFPFLSVVRMFQLNNWKYAYFFPILFGAAMLGRAVVLGVMSIEDSRRKSQSFQYDSTLTPHPAMKPLPNQDDPKDEC